MEIESFYSKCLEDHVADERQVDYFKRSFDAAVEAMGDDFTNDEFIYMLFYGESDKLSYSKFIKTRRIAARLYEFLASNGVVTYDFVSRIERLRYNDVISEYELRRCYFKNLDDVIAYISFTASNAGLDGDSELLDIKSIAILAWYGISTAQMSEIKIADLYANDGAIVASGEKTVRIEKRHLDILKMYAMSEYSTGFPSGERKKRLVASKYLIRSARNNKLDPSNIRWNLSRYNDLTSSYHKRISISCLEKNGIMYFAKESVDAESVNIAMKKIAGFDNSMSSKYGVFYSKWCEFYYGGDGA